MTALPERIVTRRLVLRLPQDRDVPEIVRNLSSYTVSQWLGRVPHPYVAWHARRWLAFHRTQQSSGLDLGFAIALLSKPDRMIGAIAFHGICQPAPILGYWLAERHWGKGYTSEALAAMLAVLNEVAPAARPVATVLPANRGSIRVLEKAQFRRLPRPAMAPNLARRRMVRLAKFVHRPH